MKIKSPKEQQIEQERLTEILIVLEEMFQREGPAGKRVIGCLYDIAVINWLNRNVPRAPLNPLLKYLARFPRGIAQNLGLRFFLQPKCPKLIADWLYTLVEFPQPSPAVIEPAEVLKLKQQVKLLTSSLIFTVVLSIGSITVLWQKERLQELIISQDKQEQLLPKTCGTNESFNLILSNEIKTDARP